MSSHILGQLWSSVPLRETGASASLLPSFSLLQRLQLGWLLFDLCGSRLALIIEAQDSCEDGMRRLDCRSRKFRDLSYLAKCLRRKECSPGCRAVSDYPLLGT